MGGGEAKRRDALVEAIHHTMGVFNEIEQWGFLAKLILSMPKRLAAVSRVLRTSPIFRMFNVLMGFICLTFMIVLFQAKVAVLFVPICAVFGCPLLYCLPNFNC